jgi:modification methylase
MQTEHNILNQDSRTMQLLEDGTIDLVVTSPPYPMIEMWDELFSSLNKQISDALKSGDYRVSFELMHQELDRVWKEVYRVLKQGGIACINIGDATRTISKRFQLYANHQRIIRTFWELGFDILPLILWRKQTNAPNKFMGSGMLPTGAYVTLEHEYILIFRKNGIRKYNSKIEKANRQDSAIFWEERNIWYSDLWDFKGTRQDLTSINSNGELRKRSGAFPFELPFRLINMYSVYGDTVLDPFLGTGTTSLAALACGRDSVGFEIDRGFILGIDEKMKNPNLPTELCNYNQRRLDRHIEFVQDYIQKKGSSPKYSNKHYGVPVVTQQEKNLKLVALDKILFENEGKYTGLYYQAEIVLEKDILLSKKSEVNETPSFHQQKII